MKIHFIAIGGSAMHNLALALHQKGYQITGSDDEIFEPSKSRLSKAGLLPETPGWFPEKIDDTLDAVVLGMHARADNPELLRAKALGLKMYSYPEYLYEQTKNKTRIVVGGSHGKTTTTAMIMHVLKHHGMAFDYMVGAQLEGFETMVRLTDDAPIAVFEGDEYLTSPIDLRPKFHLYFPTIAVLTGIAWDHINVFPTWEIYVDQFREFARRIVPGGTLIYFENDPELQLIAKEQETRIRILPYATPSYRNEAGTTVLTAENTPLRVFGKHNLQNMEAARLACEKAGISAPAFYEAISTFPGASRRLQYLGTQKPWTVYYDFAHSPSKLKATLTAVREQYPQAPIVAVMELHTFSSLNKTFLKEYEHSMALADYPMVYFDPHTVEHKQLQALDTTAIAEAFGDGVRVYNDNRKLTQDIFAFATDRRLTEQPACILLIMTSGSFSGVDIKSFCQDFFSKIFGY